MRTEPIRGRLISLAAELLLPLGRVAHAVTDAKAGRESNGVAAGLLVLAILMGSFTGVIIRYLQSYEAVQIVFLRSALVMTVLLPGLLLRGAKPLQVNRPGLLLLRACCGAAGQYLTVLAILSLPLATVQALGFTRAFILALLGALIFGEAVGKRRWSAIVLGFFGVVVIVNPGVPFAAVPSNGVFYALGGTFAFACSITLSKILLRDHARGTLMVWNATLHAALWLIPTMWIWSTPSLADSLLFVLMAALVLVVQPLSLQAFRFGDVSALAPVDYLRLLTGAAAGFVFFGEVPGANLWLGALLILAANLLIDWRQAPRGKTSVGT